MKIAIVGLGALGSVAAKLLASSKCSEIALIDRDIVEKSNLGRQHYAKEDVGKEKAIATAEKIKHLKVTPCVVDINYRTIALLKKYDIILDCTDNLYTRFLINEFCKKHNIPWVYAGVIRNHGMVMAIKDKPCFRCLVQETDALDTCEVAGVDQAASFAIAKLQVQEAWKLPRMDFFPELVHYNNGKISRIKVSPKKGCPVCNRIYEYLEGKRELPLLSYQCSGFYIFFKKIEFPAMKKKLSAVKNIRQGKDYLLSKNLTIFKNGRIIIRAPSKEKAKSLLARYIGI